MRKYPHTVVYDKLHKGAVICCIGLTIYGAALLGNHAYRYFKHVRPQVQASKAAAEQELLSEGAPDRAL